MESKTIEMFSMRARNKSKHTIVTTKFYETLEGKVMFKDTISKSPYVLAFIWKQYPENFAFLILRIIELFTHEDCKFLKE